MKLTLALAALALSACASTPAYDTASDAWRECDSQVWLTMYLLNTDEASVRDGYMGECMRLKGR